MPVCDVILNRDLHQVVKNWILRDHSENTLSTRIIRNREAFFPHHILRCLNELCNDYGIETIFAQTVSFKREILKKFETELDFFPSGKCVIGHSSTMNPCWYSVAVLKGQGLTSHKTNKHHGKHHGKHHVWSFEAFVSRKRNPWRLRHCWRYLFKARH